MVIFTLNTLNIESTYMYCHKYVYIEIMKWKEVKDDIQNLNWAEYNNLIGNL